MLITTLTKKRLNIKFFLIPTFVLVAIGFIVYILTSKFLYQSKASWGLDPITGNSITCATAEDSRLYIQWNTVSNANHYYIRIKESSKPETIYTASGNSVYLSAIIGTFTYSLQAKNYNTGALGPQTENFTVTCSEPCNPLTNVKSCQGCLSCRRKETYNSPFTSDIVWCNKEGSVSECSRSCSNGNPITGYSNCPIITPIVNPTAANVVGPTNTPIPSPTIDPNATPTPIVVNIRDNCFIDPEDKNITNGTRLSFWLTSAPNGWTPNIRYTYSQTPVPGVNVSTCPSPSGTQRGVKECELQTDNSKGSVLWIMTNYSRIIDGNTYVCRFDSKWVKILPDGTSIEGTSAAPNNNPGTYCVNECRKWVNVLMTTITPILSPTPSGPLSCATGLTSECLIDSSGTQKVRLTWNLIPGAERYLIRLNAAPISDWVNTAKGDTSIYMNSGDSAVVEPNVLYSWRVQGLKSGEGWPAPLTPPKGCITSDDYVNIFNCPSTGRIAR